MLLQGPNRARTEEAVEALAQLVRKDPALVLADDSNLLYRGDSESLRKFGLFYLGEEGLREVGGMLDMAKGFFDAGPLSLSAVVTQMNSQLAPGRQSGDSAMVEFLPRFLAAVEAGLRTGATPEPALLFDSMAAAGESPYLAFDDGRALLLLITPSKRGDGFTPYGDSIVRLRAIVAGFRNQFPDVKIGLTGEPILTDDEQNTYQRDTSIALAITVAIVFLIFAYAYRQIARPVLKIGVLIGAIVVSLAFTAATVGHLNMLSVAFVVMILGLGDDFAIYVITRYEEERFAGKAPAPAMEVAMVEAGHAVVMSSLTIAVSFLTMAFTGFVGLVEMGIIAAGGILICAALCLTFLPALLLCQRGERVKEQKVIRHFFTPLLQRAERWWLRHATWVVGATILVVVICTFAAFRLQAIPASWNAWRAGGEAHRAFGPVMRVPFQYDLLDMQNPSLESVQTVRALSELQSIYFAAIVADSLDEVKRVTAALSAQPSVGSVVSILGSTARGTPTLPDANEAIQPLAQAVQEKAALLQISAAETGELAALREQTPLLASRLERTARTVRAMGEISVADALEAAAISAESIHELLQSLSPQAAEARLVALQKSMAEMFGNAVAALSSMSSERGPELSDLPDSLKKRYVGKTGKFLLEVYPAEDLRHKPNLEAFTREVLAAAPLATGTPIELDLFVDLLKVSYMKAALYALGFVTLLVWFYFRNFRTTLLCLFPLFAGIIVMLGLMQFFGLAFNLANIITLPLIIGVGVDNGVLILQRFRKTPDIALFKGNIGRAILMSNLSTIAGFAALSLADHQGIASLGLIMTIGVGATMLISLITLPAMIHWCKRRSIAL